MSRSCALLVVVGGLGCGSSAGGGGPDGDTTPPQLVSSTPANDARGIGVLEPLKVQFDEPLAPATVPGALSLAVGEFEEPVFGMASYDDAALTITFVPDQPLVHGSRYVLRVDARLTDLAGNGFTGAAIPFNTYINAATRRVWRLPTGVVNSWTGTALDLDGHAVKDLSYSAPGPDTIWLTTDDLIGSRLDMTYTAAGAVLEERGYDPGLDLTYDTGDDVMSSLTVHAYDADARATGHTNLSGPGGDTAWGTPDDVIANYYVHTWEGGRPTRTTKYADPGADGTWRTADDGVSTFFAYAHDAAGLRTRETRYQSGPDALAGTADDVIVYYTDTVYTQGVATQQSSRGAGVDGVWFTADDTYLSASRLSRDANGLLVDRAQLTSPGGDGTWFTSDDVVGTRIRYTYDTNGQRVSQTSFAGPGVDLTWDTGDDEISSYELVTYDPQGNRKLGRTYGDPGTDNIWKTIDDPITSETDFDLAH